MALLWRTRRWQLLLDLIDGLPSASLLAEARSEDEDAARAYLEQTGDEQPAWRPRVAEWTNELAELMTITDRLSELIALSAANVGVKVPVRPRPRPQTAVDRLREALLLDGHRKLVARLLPGRH